MRLIRDSDVFWICIVLFSCFWTRSILGSLTRNCSQGFQGAFCDECGQVFSQQNLKIVGGIDAVAYSWPSIAYIKFNYKETFSIPNGQSMTYSFSGACGGTLIDRQTILTAAHCITTKVQFSYQGTTYEGKVEPNSFYPTIESMYTVYLGLHDKSSLDRDGTYSLPTLKMSVSKVVVHAGYSSSNYLNDIALIYLSSNVTLNNFIQIACLPTVTSSSYPGTNLNVYAAGWGTLYSDGPTPSKLNNVKLTAYSSQTCSRVANLGMGQICAGNINGGQDTCQGDSGGPLYFADTINSKSKYIVAGVTSYGYQCAQRNYPGVYTRVSYYLDWINDQTSFTINSGSFRKSLTFLTSTLIFTKILLY